MVLSSCKQKKNLPEKNSTQQIIKADEAFSELSKKEGMKKAFIEYINDEGALLRPGHLGIIGANSQ